MRIFDESQGELEKIDADVKRLGSCLRKFIIDLKELSGPLNEISIYDLTYQDDLEERTHWPDGFYNANYKKMRSLKNELDRLSEKGRQIKKILNEGEQSSKKNILAAWESTKTDSVNTKYKLFPLHRHYLLGYMLTFLDTKSVAQAWVLVSSTEIILKDEKQNPCVNYANTVYQTPLNRFVLLFSRKINKPHLLLNQDNFQTKTSVNPLKLKHLNKSLRYLELKKKIINTDALIGEELEKRLYLEFKEDQGKAQQEAKKRVTTLEVEAAPLKRRQKNWSQHCVIM